MRALWVVLSLLILLMPSAGAIAWSDPAGDVEAVAVRDPCTTSAVPSGWYPQVDVTAMELGELQDDLVLKATVASMDPGDEPQQPAFAYYGVSFTWNDRPWAYYIEHDLAQRTFFAWMYIQGGYTPSPGWSFEPELWGTSQVALDGSTLTTTWRKSFFHHEDWSPMRAGDALRNVAPFSRTTTGPACDAAIPQFIDPIGEPEDMTIRLGNDQLGNVFLHSPNPTRSSNGAATTYVFDVEARNTGDLDDDIELQLQVPKDWVVRAPGHVQVPAQGTTPFAVAVTVPFVHEHGIWKDLRIRGVSTAESGKETELALRVYWSDPPHVGGHHARLHLHEQYGRFPSMRTVVDEDPQPALPEDVTDSDDPVPETRTYRWNYSINPALGMGLDFQPGAVTGATAFNMPIDADVTATARLILTGDDPRILAQQTQEASWTAGTHRLDWRLPMEPDVDRIPPVPGQSLQMRIELAYPQLEPPVSIGGVTHNQPSMPVDEGAFELPLVDYHAVLDADQASQLATLTLDVEESVKPANPHGTVLFRFDAANIGATGIDVAWNVEGPRDWGRLDVAKTHIRSGEARNVTLIVEVPSDAQDGDSAEFLVTGTDLETGQTVFGRALVTVTTTREILDERPLVPDEESPAEASPLPWIPTVVVLVAWAASRRRG